MDNLRMTLLPYLGLERCSCLLSIQGQKALKFHPKHFNFCYKDEQCLERHEGG